MKAAVIAHAIPLTAVQVEYNLSQRTAERELMNMATYFGLGTMLYSPLAGGLLTGKYRQGASGRLAQGGAKQYQEDRTTKVILDTLERIAREVEATPGQVALAWTLTKNAFPIIGVRSLAHLTDSLGALTIHLSTEQIAGLDQVSSVTMGYPHDLLRTVQKAY